MSFDSNPQLESSFFHFIKIYGTKNSRAEVKL